MYMQVSKAAQESEDFDLDEILHDLDHDFWLPDDAAEDATSDEGDVRNVMHAYDPPRQVPQLSAGDLEFQQFNKMDTTPFATPFAARSTPLATDFTPVTSASTASLPGSFLTPACNASYNAANGNVGGTEHALGAAWALSRPQEPEDGSGSVHSLVSDAALCSNMRTAAQIMLPSASQILCDSAHVSPPLTPKPTTHKGTDEAAGARSVTLKAALKAGKSAKGRKRNAAKGSSARMPSNDDLVIMSGDTGTGVATGGVGKGDRGQSRPNSLAQRRYRERQKMKQMKLCQTLKQLQHHVKSVDGLQNDKSALLVCLLTHCRALFLHFLLYMLAFAAKAAVFFQILSLFWERCICCRSFAVEKVLSHVF
jgi:hypothetical protein